MTDIERIKELLPKITPAPWAIWTSCSYRRIGSDATGREVAYPTTQRDGHPDIVFPNGGADGPDAEFIALCRNNIEAIIAENERLRTQTNFESNSMQSNEINLLMEENAGLRDELTDLKRNFDQAIAANQSIPALESEVAVLRVEIAHAPLKAEDAAKLREYVVDLLVLHKKELTPIFALASLAQWIDSRSDAAALAEINRLKAPQPGLTLDLGEGKVGE